jgi:hypothetical protein
MRIHIWSKIVSLGIEKILSFSITSLWYKFIKEKEGKNMKNEDQDLSENIQGISNTISSKPTISRSLRLFKKPV